MHMFYNIDCDLALLIAKIRLYTQWFWKTWCIEIINHLLHLYTYNYTLGLCSPIEIIQDMGRGCGFGELFIILQTCFCIFALI